MTDEEAWHAGFKREPDTESRTRFGLLLVAISAAFAIQGVATPGRWEQLAVALLLGVTLLLALSVAETERRIMQAAIVVVVVIGVFSVIAAITGDSQSVSAKIANVLLVLLAPPAILLGIVRNLRARNRVTIEAVFGVLCLYLLLGMLFAFVYALIGRVDGTFFANGVSTTTARVIYFSFATLTTVGYGDYTAGSNLGHTLAVTEALFGQIYLVTVVAVIVGNLGRSSLPEARRNQGADAEPGDAREAEPGE